MSQCSEFIHHTLIFEQAFITDDWSLLEPFYSADAIHTVLDGGPLACEDIGPAAIARGLGRGVHVVDRRFDVRIPQIIEGPTVREDGVWMRFRLTFRRAGLPELNIEGEHRTVHRGGRIVEFREVLAPGHGAMTETYLREHDAALRPVGAPYAPIMTAADHRDLEPALQGIFVRCYGMAKGQQDIEAALMLCHPDFALEGVPFRTASRNRDETCLQLGAFFAAFPDFQPDIQDLLAGGGRAACWGQVRMTHGGDLFGLPATGKTARLPFFSAFEFKDGLLSKEIFFIDLAMLCDQLDLPIEHLLPVVRMLPASSAPVAVHA